jgi:arylsulfatase
MKHRTFVKIFIAVVFIIVFEQQSNGQAGAFGKPNIVYILADDLGYGDVGAYGQQKIETPNIDALAKNGMLFTQHYALPICAPSRYSLMTGIHSGHAFIRGNDEWEQRGDVWNFAAMEANPALEGQLPVPDSTRTIARVLKQAGYKTALVGKWGLGGPFTTGIPNKQGFDYFYGYLCQRQDHNYYSGHLWENENRVPLNNKVMDPNIKFPDNLDPLDEKNYEVYSQTDYSPDFLIRAAFNFLDRVGDAPFFLYYASPLPHTSLQAPKRLVDYYRKKFGDEKPFLGGSYVPVRYPHATRAAMITLLDEQVGEIIKKLKELNLFENTIIVFTGDNGATFEAGSDPEWFNSGGPFRSDYGWGKGFLHEGGIREPFIISWPEKIKAGSRSDLMKANWDFFPTVCEIIGEKTTADIDGISYLPTLMGRPREQKQHDFLYWELPQFGGQQAVRYGEWKGIRSDVMKGNLKVRLFNLSSDPREENDLSEKHPEIVQKIKIIMEQEHQTPIVRSFRMEPIESK